MTNERRGKKHGRRKAPPGAYSDRYGSRLVRAPAKQHEPWLKDFPSVGVPAVILPPDRSVFRRP